MKDGGGEGRLRWEGKGGGVGIREVDMDGVHGDA